MNRYKITLLILLAFSMTGQVYADLDSFSDRVIESEQNPKPETPSESSEEQSSDSGFAVLLARLFGILWLYDNVYIYYADYPYQEGGYIQHPVADPFVNKMVYADDAKYYWFSMSLSGFYLDDIGGGSWLSFSGNAYKFIGPYADVYFITDAREFQIGARLGAHFSLLQFNPFNASLYIQWQFWNGVLSRHGVAMGIELRLYPVKPLTFRFKLGSQMFERFSIGEMELEMGIMIKAWEWFVGYRSWTLGDEMIPSYAGAYLGVRRYF
ncbi:MAG: hypothetical protein LBF87_03235 [Treponema sp.]|jgi:hypothetical protein|nr:hypothetical protein [Treponema sp.]